jgi:Ferric uptake regulator family.
MGSKAEIIGSMLLKENIKPSYARIRILEYLLSRKNHPTVDEIYTALVKDIPTLSKTTVYNTLNLFVKSNIARVLTIEENETRYDADMSCHGHFKCENCGMIRDFHFKSAAIDTDDLNGFLVREKDVFYYGLCPECMAHEAEMTGMVDGNDKDNG